MRRSIERASWELAVYLLALGVWIRKDACNGQKLEEVIVINWKFEKLIAPVQPGAPAKVSLIKQSLAVAPERTTTTALLIIQPVVWMRRLGTPLRYFLFIFPKPFSLPQPSWWRNQRIRGIIETDKLSFGAAGLCTVISSQWKAGIESHGTSA